MLGQPEAVWEDASHFFEGPGDGTGVGDIQPETIFLGPHVADRPNTDQAFATDAVEYMGTKETPLQPAEITGGEGMLPQSPRHGRERGYDYQEATQAIKPEYRAMMTPVVSEPGQAGEPNPTVNAVTPRASRASGMDFKKPEISTVYTVPGVSKKTPEYLPHSGAVRGADDRNSHVIPPMLMEGLGFVDDNVSYNEPTEGGGEMRQVPGGATYLTPRTQEAASSMLTGLDDFMTAGSEEGLAQVPGDDTFIVSRDQAARMIERPVHPSASMLTGVDDFMTAGSEENLMGKESSMLTGMGQVPGSGTYLTPGAQTMNRSYSESMLSGEYDAPVADIPSITLANYDESESMLSDLGLFGRKKKRKHKRARRAAAVAKMTPQQRKRYLENRRARKHNRKKRSIKRLRALVSPQGIMAKKGADTMKRNAKKLIKRKGKRKGVNSIWKKHVDELERKAKMKTKLERQTDGSYLKKPASRDGLMAVREGMKKDVLREQYLLKEAERDKAIAAAELSMIKGGLPNEIDEDARTPDDLRMEGADLAQKVLINWGLPPTSSNVKAVSGEVSKQLVKEIVDNKVLASAEVAQREAQVKIAQDALREAEAEVPTYSEMSYDWGQLTI